MMESIAIHWTCMTRDRTGPPTDNINGVERFLKSSAEFISRSEQERELDQIIQGTEGTLVQESISVADGGQRSGADYFPVLST